MFKLCGTLVQVSSPRTHRTETDIQNQPLHSLYGGLVQYARHRNAVEALHGGHGGLHGLLLPQV